MADIRVVWDDAAVKIDCQAPDGPVDRAMSKLADSCVLTMKYKAPVYHGPRRGPKPGHPRQSDRKSGQLRASVTKFRQSDGSWLIGPTDMVGGKLLGPMIDRGTPPHLIRSSGPWPLFNAATMQAFGHVVHHPGTRPNPFISSTADSLTGVVVRIPAS